MANVNPATPSSGAAVDHRRHRGARDRIATAIAIAATLLGVWLGLVAPSTTPVAPVVPAPAVTTAQTAAAPGPGAP